MKKRICFQNPGPDDHFVFGLEGLDFSDLKYIGVEYYITDPLFAEPLGAMLLERNGSVHFDSSRLWKVVYSTHDLMGKQGEDIPSTVLDDLGKLCRKEYKGDLPIEGRFYVYDSPADFIEDHFELAL